MHIYSLYIVTRIAKRCLSFLSIAILIIAAAAGTANVYAAVPSYDVKEFGSLSTALTAIGQDTAIIRVSERQILNNLVVPSNISLKFEPGGSILVTRGRLVELNGPLIAPIQHIFEGDGMVRIRQGAVKEAFPQWWGAKGDGVTNDRTALERCFQYNLINLGSSTYSIGDLPRSNVVIFKFVDRKNLTIKGNSATIICNSLERAASHVFYFDGCENVRVSGITFKDLGYLNDLSSGAQGAIFMSLWSTFKRGMDVVIDTVNVDSAMAFLIVGNSNGNKNRVYNIDIKNVTVSNSYYGINCQNNGDNMIVRNYICTSVKRSYFVYGVSHHDVDVSSNLHQPSSSDILIKTYDQPTSDLVIRFKSRNNLNPDAMISFEHQSALPVSIQNVRVEMDIDATVKGVPVVFRSYTPGGALETVTKNSWKEIELSGLVNVTANSILVMSRQETKNPITLKGQLGVFDAKSLQNSFIVNDQRI